MVIIIEDSAASFFSCCSSSISVASTKVGEHHSIHGMCSFHPRLDHGEWCKYGQCLHLLDQTQPSSSLKNRSEDETRLHSGPRFDQSWYRISTFWSAFDWGSLFTKESSSPVWSWKPKLVLHRTREYADHIQQVLENSMIYLMIRSIMLLPDSAWVGSSSWPRYVKSNHPTTQPTRPTTTSTSIPQSVVQLGWDGSKGGPALLSLRDGQDSSSSYLWCLLIDTQDIGLLPDKNRLKQAQLCFKIRWPLSHIVSK